MSSEGHTAVAAETAEAYRYLEPRPDSWRRQLHLKGRNLAVGTLLWKMRANGHTPESAAADYDLPLEQIQEALRYGERHREVIERDAAEERDYLRAAGIIRDAATPRR
ncbi:MAG: DUF433 domain-containing protein [Chloroflexi bacterium]|nr:DUF433 domain-containing protein [Chloroflexota bacterium]